jgi:hypothetical protein
LQFVSGDFRSVHYTACAKARISFSADIDIAHTRLIAQRRKHMPLPTLHSLSTGVAGFVIAAYWLMYVVVIGFEAAYPTALDAPREAAQVCERDTSHNEIGSCGSIDSGEAAAQAETAGNGTL